MRSRSITLLGFLVIASVVHACTNSSPAEPARHATQAIDTDTADIDTPDRNASVILNTATASCTGRLLPLRVC
jgi:hypothetical protein